MLVHFLEGLCSWTPESLKVNSALSPTERHADFYHRLGRTQSPCHFWGGSEATSKKQPPACFVGGLFRHPIQEPCRRDPERECEKVDSCQGRWLPEISPEEHLRWGKPLPDADCDGFGQSSPAQIPLPEKLAHGAERGAPGGHL